MPELYQHKIKKQDLPFCGLDLTIKRSAALQPWPNTVRRIKLTSLGRSKLTTPCLSKLTTQQAMLNAKFGSRITFWNRIFELSVYFVVISVVVLFPYENFGLDVTSNLMKAGSPDRVLGLVIILLLFLAGYLLIAGLSNLRRLPVF